MEDPVTNAMMNSAPAVEAPPDFGTFSGEPFYLTDAHVLFCCVIMISAVLVPIAGALLSAVARALSRRVSIRGSSCRRYFLRVFEFCMEHALHPCNAHGQ